MQKKFIYLAAVGLYVLSAAVLPGSAHARSTSYDTIPVEAKATGIQNEVLHRKSVHKGVVGAVKAISGSLITLVGPRDTIYSIDTAKVSVLKTPIEIASDPKNIMVGDRLAVRGTLSGTSVTATHIVNMSVLERSVFHGKVTAIDGTTLTIIGPRKTTYTINAVAAKITKGFRDQTAVLVTDISVGDKVTAVGTQSGTTIAATRVFIGSGAKNVAALLRHKN